jgi:hypothetical protein
LAVLPADFLRLSFTQKGPWQTPIRPFQSHALLTDVNHFQIKKGRKPISPTVTTAQKASLGLVP